MSVRKQSLVQRCMQQKRDELHERYPIRLHVRVMRQSFADRSRAVVDPRASVVEPESTRVDTRRRVEDQPGDRVTPVGVGRSRGRRGRRRARGARAAFCPFKGLYARLNGV